MDESYPNRNMPNLVNGNLDRRRRVTQSRFLSLQHHHLLHLTPNSLKFFRIKCRCKGHNKPFSFSLSHGSKSISNTSFARSATACPSVQVHLQDWEIGRFLKTPFRIDILKSKEKGFQIFLFFLFFMSEHFD